MKTLTKSAHRSGKFFFRPQARLKKIQQGVVLIISLIMLVVISLLAVSSMRNAGSTESVLSNVRTTELATQAAEIALRHCEASVVELNGGSGEYETNGFDKSTNILVATTPPTSQWQKLETWDTGSPSIFILPEVMLNQAGITKTYRRPPECMVERVTKLITGLDIIRTVDGTRSVVGKDGTELDPDSSYIITARGFGPEVAVGPGRPQGSEVWLQSHIQLNNLITNTPEVVVEDD